MIWKNKRIERGSINKYLKEKYPEAKNIQLYQHKKVLSIYKPLIQKDYGLSGDCSLTALTTVICGIVKKQPQEVYNVVEKYAKQYGFKGNGTNPLFIKSIFDKSLKDFGLNKKTKFAYLKSISYNFNKIQSLIDSNIPIILNIYKDGRNYYDDHSIVIIGYLIYKIDDMHVPMLLVYDNWVERASVVDYNILSIISSINYCK